METHDAGKQMREEPLAVPEEGTLALHAAKLLQKRLGQDLRIRELLEGLLARSPRVEKPVGLIGEAEKHDHGVFRSGEAWGRVSEGHLLLLVEGSRMAPFVPSLHATLI